MIFGDTPHSHPAQQWSEIRAAHSETETATTDFGNAVAPHPLRRRAGRGLKGGGGILWSLTHPAQRWSKIRVSHSDMETATTDISNDLTFHPHPAQRWSKIRVARSEMETATTDFGNAVAPHPLQRSVGRGTKGVGRYRELELFILNQIFSTKFKLGI